LWLAVIITAPAARRAAVLKAATGVGQGTFTRCTGMLLPANTDATCGAKRSEPKRRSYPTTMPFSQRQLRRTKVANPCATRPTFRNV